MPPSVFRQKLGLRPLNTGGNDDLIPMPIASILDTPLDGRGLPMGK
jgi:hypothetical protein